MESKLVFFVNGCKVEVPHPDPTSTLLHFLRQNLYLTGTKLACGAGWCGACTVMVSKFHHDSKTTSHRQVMACMVPLCWVHGLAVTTVEGLGTTATGLLNIQTSLAARGGVQCGFCSPGMVISMFTLLRNHPSPSLEDIKAALEGNLCRCTGYRGILDGFCDAVKGQCCQEKAGGGCPCREAGGSLDKVPGKADTDSEGKGSNSVDQVAIFPPELKLSDELERDTVVFRSGQREWIRPSSLTELLKAKADHPHAPIVGACSSLYSFWRSNCVVITVSGVRELCRVELSDSGVKVGSAVTLASLIDEVDVIMKSLPETESRHLQSVRQMVSRIASPQIRSVGTVGGNLLGTHYPSDIRTVLAVIGASVVFCNKSGEERVVSLWDIAASPLTSVMEKSEILTSIFIPLSKQTQFTYATKVQEREGFDTATVNAALCLELVPPADLLASARLAVGGQVCPAGATVPFDLTQALSGRELNGSVLNEVFDTVNKTLGPNGSEGGKLSNYLHQLLLGCVFDLFSRHLNAAPSQDCSLPSIPYKTSRVYETVDGGQPALDPVGRPVSQFSSLPMTSGEAVYIRDIPHMQGELSVGLVLSKRAHARLESVDWRRALAVEGVTGCLDHSDIPGDKLWAAGGIQDMPVFAIDEVCYKGQIIGFVLAEDERTASYAASLVEVVYSDLPSVFTIEEAVAAESYFTQPGTCPELAVGDVEVAMATQGVTVVTGQVSFDGQEHWYMEPQSVLAVPQREHQEMEVFCASHHITLNQVACQPDGTIVAADFQLYLNSGMSVDLNHAVLQLAVQNTLASYRIPNMRVKGFLCRTNLPPNTSMRGFGAPESILSSELVIDNIATALNLPRMEVQKKNMHREGDVTFTNQKLAQCNLGKCYEQCAKSSLLEERQKAVEDFNKQNTRKKRGISIVPILFPVGFPFLFMKQAGALVHVYTDGSVWLTHGGTEMGQGIHIKMMQIASRVLGVPLSKIHISQVSTTLVPNTSSTAGSISSDYNGWAVKDACEQIHKRLAPVREENPDKTWESWVSAAYFKRISLSAFGFYGTKETQGWSFETNAGSICNYFSYGAGCSEVELDILTGQHRVLRVDIVMDAGRSLNPAVDMGQVEGAFMQGYGMMMMERVEVGSDGTIMPDGLGRYKIPGVRNIPEQFNVAFLENCHNTEGIYSSKGIGEPPLLLASSVFVAMRDAVRAARCQAGLTGHFQLDCPAIPSRVLAACGNALPAFMKELESKK